jgi:hypothetical protein
MVVLPFMFLILVSLIKKSDSTDNLSNVLLKIIGFKDCSISIGIFFLSVSNLINQVS